MRDWQRDESRTRVGFDCSDCGFITTDEWELDEHLIETGHRRPQDLLKSNRRLLIGSGIAALLIIPLTGALYVLLVGGIEPEEPNAGQHYNAGAAFLVQRF